MSKGENNGQQKKYNQMAWILNYQPIIGEQHIHIEEKGTEDEPTTEEAEYEELNNEAQKEPVKDGGVKASTLNYKSPTIVLQRMLEGDWFDKVCTNSMLYSVEWRRKLVADLMASSNGTHIATLWAHERKRTTIKGRFLGTLSRASVLCSNKAAVARAFLGFSDHTRDADEKREVNTFANYIGQWKMEPYADWVIDYVNKTTQ